ncbi:hypothetical protein TPHA_0C04200 [Tetrapisispora phaffii CBS 4417]|uniref:HMG box domain-containing protein n=1 Tax=Tetrapisispora phaffii (strain ATCC 24235 / CBS 4417 / NBRC 1672 / NRRL Y-8282 / UCD 70-5) TaxID=1071381 RepID=G8BQQ8_TETPH|nr:hypothetical protein TPHA_0C04200 [Tetrapisispora phaffii CBS 4417]CCE62570.1 hypothetical protein TPHA_0C04200 [Tetrapisispora phaffii CBS 4417]
MNSSILSRQLSQTSRRTLVSTNAKLFSTIPSVQLQASAFQLAKKSKGKKVNDAPPRPGSAYMMWVKHIRPEFANEHPNEKPTGIVKLMAQHWKTLSDSEKEPFYQAYNKALATYQEKKRAYEATLPPKRPAGPFISFCKDNRTKVLNENPHLSTIEATQKIAELWKSASETEKAQYLESYKTALHEWQSKYGKTA